MKAPDVIVIGAGAIGLAVARELAGRGRSVVVVERGSPGREATWAAAGMLSPLGEAARMPALRELADASLDLWPAFAEALLEDTGADVEYRPGGALHLAFDAGDEAALRALAERAREHAAMLGAAEVRERVPGVSPNVIAGLAIARDHRVNNRRLGQALWSAAVGAGADFRLGTEVAGIECGRNGFRAVLLTSGERMEAGACVIAAGAWAGRLTGLPGALPVRPVRGQMFAVAPRPEHRLPTVLVTPHGYIVPRADGRILVGATVEEVDFAPGPTPAGIATLFDAAARALPALQSATLTETWAGYRPGTPDGRPILGADPDATGLFHATGHFRNGILLTPITALAVADAVEGGDPAPGPFSVSRFRT